MGDWLEDLVNGLFTQFVMHLGNLVIIYLVQVLTLLDQLIWRVPPVTDMPAVRTVWGQMLLVVNAVYVLVIVAAGVLAMTYDSVQTRYSVKELLPRLVVGAIAANFSLAFMELLLPLPEAVVFTVAGESFADADIFRIEQYIAGALVNPLVELLVLILAVIAVVLLYLLLFQWYVRFGILVVLAMVAPLALASYALPGLDQAAALWWRTFGGVMAIHVLQGLMLIASLRIFFAPDASLPVYTEQDGLAGGIHNLILVIMVLYSTFKVSPLVRRLVMRSGGGGGSGLKMVALLVVQQFTRGLGKVARVGRP